MHLSEEFRKRAQECFAWACAATTGRRKAFWLALAQFWVDRAQDRERSQEQGISSMVCGVSFEVLENQNPGREPPAATAPDSANQLTP